MKINTKPSPKKSMKYIAVRIDKVKKVIFSRKKL